MRLTLALDFKLDRDAARDAREAEKAAAEAEASAPRPEPERPPPSPTKLRKARVEGLLTRVLWNESEGDSEDYEILLEDLSARLDEAARSPEFEITPVEVIARRIASDMGLEGEIKLTLCEPAQQIQPTDTG